MEIERIDEPFRGSLATPSMRPFLHSNDNFFYGTIESFLHSLMELHLFNYMLAKNS